MKSQTEKREETLDDETRDRQPRQQPVPSYGEPGQMGPMNTTPEVPGADAPEVSTGNRFATDEPADETDEPAEETDEPEVGEIESENP
ncbi:hypothetical protein [Dyadobacter fanqingshengii]|uniref:Uncharacterized protein n=1 Tax=Dyadobacter fanqingshengii TaxID=2906443 RepID=A0A9X1T9U3_9BACT|nr:hypothetical protein [Dyadobacter fanqingshengii]MCF0041016.1 hypothetical protein [Dyadobacter fanqingshengii]MCF2505878.1 hypothetical protein [Dyadobacter fanqingshengii]USJ37253.1 hypothetical protein NFI81_05620 [Dyadobacter fanqingshengii]